MPSNRHVAVWIDHREARIFHIDADALDERTMRAPTHHVHRHEKGASAEHNHPDDLHHFFKAVAHELQGAERILIVGPSTCKIAVHWVCPQARSPSRATHRRRRDGRSPDRRAARRLRQALFHCRRSPAGGARREHALRRDRSSGRPVAADLGALSRTGVSGYTDAHA